MPMVGDDDRLLGSSFKQAIEDTVPVLAVP